MEPSSTSGFKVPNTSLLTEQSFKHPFEPTKWLVDFEGIRAAVLREANQASQVDSKLDEVCVLEQLPDV